MFYDERIHNSKGKAFRNTIFLAELLMVVYAVIHFIFNCYNDIYTFSSIATELIGSVFGLILILYGEIKYGIRNLDEMQQNNKNTYYAKAFFVFLYSFIFVYCINTPFELLNSRRISLPPNNFLFFLEIPCWIFLLFFLKSENVPLNAEFLQEDLKTYTIRVCMNILKFGGICAVFTAISFALSQLYLIVTQSGINLFTLSFAIAIILYGVLTWISFSIEYILFSIAERVSDRAQEHNKISIIVLVFAVIITLFRIASTAFSIYSNIYYETLNNAQTVTLVNSVHRYISWMACYFSGLFAVYLMSEIKNRIGKTFSKITFIYVVVLISSYCYDIISTIVFNILSAGEFDSERLKKLLEIFSNTSGIIDIVLSAGTLVISICAIRALIKAGVAKAWLIIYPVGTFIMSKIIITVIITFRESSSYNVVISVLYITLIILCIMFIAGFCSVYQNINKKQRYNPNNIDSSDF